MSLNGVDDHEFPGHQPVDETATFAFSPRWDMDTVQLLVMWATAFLVYITDTQFWAVLGYTQFCVAVAVKQRFKHPRSLIGTEGTYEKIPLRFSRRVLWFDFREEDRIHWRGRIFGTRTCSSCAMRTKLTMKCSSLWCTTSAKRKCDSQR